MAHRQIFWHLAPYVQWIIITVLSRNSRNEAADKHSVYILRINRLVFGDRCIAIVISLELMYA